MTNDVQDTPSPGFSIAIIAYAGVQQAAVLGLQDLMTIANRFAVAQGGAPLQVTILEGAGLRCAADAPVYTAVIVPPNLSGARGAADTLALDVIARQHALGATICSACAGVFWLGAAGLLAGRAVTTHWALEQEFKQRFPGSAVRPDEILIDDNDIVTAGGMMAWVDLGLFLVERYLGVAAMTFTARHLLVDPRGRQQANYRTFRPRLTHGDMGILQLQHWMEVGYREDMTVSALAARVPCAERTFIRRFKAATGLPPNRYVQALRVEKARGLLEQTGRSVQDIGWTVGYEDISAFGRVFKSVTGTTPGAYRTRFGSVAARP